MSLRSPQQSRSEWTRLIGARRPADASWRMTQTAGGHAGSRSTITLRSHGLDLRAVLLLPDGPSPAPVVVIPFYDVASLLGESSPLYPDTNAQPSRAFARAFANAGVGVLALPWWAESAVAHPAPLDLHARYAPIAAAHLARYPEVTGLGRSVADALLAIDALTQVNGVDGSRIGMFGHSLGGKVALFTAALDTRVAACITHEPGLGLAHSNWSDPWYLGDAVPQDRDLDEVLSLIAPRPVLYAGGGAADGAHNRALVDAARATGARIETLSHMNGHPVPADALRRMITWMRERLGVTPRR